MKTNEIKKGDRIKLKNGWEGVMMDNRRGNIRMAKIEGLVEEIGSIYAKDISAVFKDGKWEKVELTKKQKETAEMLKVLGF